MKNFLFISIFLIAFFTNAQCTYDESCTISPAFPNICPVQLPDATVGESYDTDLTFWMPIDFEAEGFEVTLTALTVTQITGLPIGLSVELSNSSMVFYPSDNEFGCANVNGIPFASGDYVITVYVVADVTVSSVGFEIAYPTQFDLYLTVNPGSGGNNSFTYSPSNGCEDLEVVFEALITSDEYEVEYIWDFGNGSTSNEQYPDTQIYDEAGDFEVTLETNLTSNNIELDNFNIDWVSNDCYGGDFEEYCWDLWLIGSGCWSDPDLFLKIYDANSNLIYQTGGIGSGAYITGTSASWSNINLTLNNPPYTVEIWDTEAWDILDGLEDLVGIPLDVQVSDDDLLGSYVLNLENGQHSYSSGCSNGSYSITSNEIPLDAIISSETISVFEQPDLETMLDEDLYMVYVDYDNALSYQWFLDGEEIIGAGDSSYNVIQSGTYYVEYVTKNGCNGTSEPIDVVKCAEDISPAIITGIFVLSTVDTEYNIEWYFSNTNSGDGVYYGSGVEINVEGNDGYYWFIMSDQYGCNWNSDTVFYQSPNNDIDNDGIDNDVDDDIDGDGIVNSEDDDVDGDGIPDDIDNDIDGDGIDNEDDDTISGYLFINELSKASISVYPNPSNGIFNIKLSDFDSYVESKIIVRDLKGNLILVEDREFINETILDLSFLPKSIYLLNLHINSHTFSHRIILK